MSAARSAAWHAALAQKYGGPCPSDARYYQILELVESFDFQGRPAGFREAATAAAMLSAFIRWCDANGQDARALFELNLEVHRDTAAKKTPDE